jgi:signal transduction histidine kinase
VSDNDIRLLVIDDDPGAFALVNQMLLTIDRPRIKLDWVDSFDKGLAALRHNNYDAYVIDYRLGDQDGISLLRQAVESGIDAPILLLTAYGTYDVDLEVMRLGATDYLDKRHLTPELLERSIRYSIERKRNERELRRLNGQVAALEQLKTEMIRVAAHDLKNPITSILMNLYMLENLPAEIAPETRARLDAVVKNIHTSVDAMHKITSSILSLEHIEELHKSNLYDTEVNSVVTSVCSEYAPQARLRSQTLTLHLTDEPLHVLSDAALLSQVVRNLVENAIKYTPEEGRIEVRLKRLGDEMVFEVEDNGVGIPEQFREKIFQPFMRVGGGQEDTAGTGLGLYLVKSIVLRHKGRMIFDSTPGQGSTFGFGLPLLAVPAPVPVPAPEVEVKAEAKPQT